MTDACEIIENKDGTLEDFYSVMSGLGFDRVYGENGDQTEPNTFCKEIEKAVGQSMVNGVVRRHTEKVKLSFTVIDNTGEIDGEICSEIDVNVSAKGNIVLSETLYAKPEDMPKWTELYLNLLK